MGSSLANPAIARECRNVALAPWIAASARLRLIADVPTAS